ncbi:UNVERIFIED_CONTAM: hypothetical protein Slati_2925200 [Sesamum latifolium]|uniref:Uncharacterized protein n=1 Tax=Sesamum latifolium TaxID=2727402 RepID=A0AAW2VD78_9LAMI
MDKATSSQVASSASRELAGSRPRARWVRASLITDRELTGCELAWSRTGLVAGCELARSRARQLADS